jgi:phosphopantetheinyl transferase
LKIFDSTNFWLNFIKNGCCVVAPHHYEAPSVCTYHDYRRICRMTCPTRRRLFMNSRKWLYYLIAYHTPGARLVLPNRLMPHAWYYSISHTSEWISVAISPMPIGIDIECTNRSFNWQGVARRKNWPVDHAYLTLRRWTQAEAHYKSHVSHPVIRCWSHASFILAIATPACVT